MKTAKIIFILKRFFEIVFILLSPLTFLSAFWLKVIKKAGTGKINENIFIKLGILPILDHYYEPLINPKEYLKRSLRENRNLQGIDFNILDQLDLLSKFNYNNELLNFPIKKRKVQEFFYDNNSYASGDAEYLYNMVRYFKPRNFIEIGSGYSTLMVRNAIKKNQSESAFYCCEHICVEPYEQPWLETIDVKVLRKKVEDIDLGLFKDLGRNDILFIDSSHIIRPQGDVLFEYFEILPILSPGVLIHIHDIFSPKDYLNEWIYNHRLWNEQYLLEAFLMFNTKYKIIGSLNFLSHSYQEEFSNKCPVYKSQEGREPGSLWLVKV